MPEYPPVPRQPPSQDTGLLAAWYAAAVHEEEIDWIMGLITVSPYLELTTGPSYADRLIDFVALHMPHHKLTGWQERFVRAYFAGVDQEPGGWYPGQPEPQRPRSRPCKCAYVRRFVPDAPGPYSPITDPSGTTRWFTWCFVIVFDCPHHGDDRLEDELVLDEAYPDGGVWGFTIDDC